MIQNLPIISTQNGEWICPTSGTPQSVTPQDKALARRIALMFRQQYQEAMEHARSSLFGEFEDTMLAALRRNEFKNVGMVLCVTEKTEHTTPISRGLSQHLRNTVRDVYGDKLLHLLETIARRFAE